MLESNNALIVQTVTQGPGWSNVKEHILKWGGKKPKQTTNNLAGPVETYKGIVGAHWKDESPMRI